MGTENECTEQKIIGDSFILFKWINIYDLGIFNGTWQNFLPTEFFNDTHFLMDLWDTQNIHNVIITQVHKTRCFYVNWMV